MASRRDQVTVASPTTCPNYWRQGSRQEPAKTPAGKHHRRPLLQRSDRPPAFRRALVARRSRFGQLPSPRSFAEHRSRGQSHRRPRCSSSAHLNCCCRAGCSLSRSRTEPRSKCRKVGLRRSEQHHKANPFPHLADVTADLAARDAFTAAEKAASADGHCDKIVKAAVDDYRNLLQLDLGSYPQAGMAIDPSSTGPLGQL